MADLLLCLDSGCGIDLTNNSGRLGAAIRANSARGIKCDGTTRQIYVGTRGYAGQSNPSSETGCENRLNIDTNGDLWVGPTLSYARMPDGGDNLSVIGWPAASGQSGDRETGVVWTNGSACRQVVMWTWEARARAVAAVGFAANEQMIATYTLNMIPFFGGGGGLGSTVNIKNSFMAGFDAEQFNAGSGLSNDTQMTGIAIINPGGTLRFRGNVSMGTRDNVSTSYGDDNGVRFDNLKLFVSTGYQRTASEAV